MVRAENGNGNEHHSAKEVSIAAFLAVGGLSLGGCGELYERTDFAKSVQGKSDAEVTKAVGKPASVDASNPGRVTWTYNSTMRIRESSAHPRCTLGCGRHYARLLQGQQTVEFLTGSKRPVKTENKCNRNRQHLAESDDSPRVQDRRMAAVRISGTPAQVSCCGSILSESHCQAECPVNLSCHGRPLRSGRT